MICNFSVFYSADINECLQSDTICDHSCKNLPGGYECRCRFGFRLYGRYVPLLLYGIYVSLLLYGRFVPLLLYGTYVFHPSYYKWKVGTPLIVWKVHGFTTLFYYPARKEVSIEIQRN